MSQRVTVAIPVFNGLPHVKTAVQSVLDQTYTNLDIVVIDNASTDGTADWVESLEDPRVRLIRNATNVGLEGNWNKALDEATASPFWKMVCADDLIYPNCVETEMKVLELHSDVVMTAARRAIIDDSDKTVIKARGLAGMDGVVNGADAVRRAISRGTNIIGEPTTVMVRASAFKDIGHFDGTFQYLIDFDMWSRVLQRGDLFAIQEPLGAFRVGTMSNSGAIAAKQRGHHIGLFRKLAAEPARGISRPLLWRGITMSAAIAWARRVFYALMQLRRRNHLGGAA